MGILQNAVKIIEDGEISYLYSFLRHDCVAHTFKDGSEVMIDGGGLLGGGGDYFRSNGSLNRPGKCESWFLNEDSSFDEVKERLLWGHFDKNGKGPLKYSPFAELELDHLKAILQYNDKLAVGLSEIQLKVINYWITEKSKNA